MKHEDVDEETWFTKHVTAKIPAAIRGSAVSKAVFHVSPFHPGAPNTVPIVRSPHSTVLQC